MVAGFVAGYLRSGSYREALRLGTACGSATAFSLGLAKRNDRRPAGDDLRDRRKQGEEHTMRITELFTAQSIALDEAQQDLR